MLIAMAGLPACLGQQRLQPFPARQAGQGGGLRRSADHGHTDPVIGRLTDGESPRKAWFPEVRVGQRQAHVRVMAPSRASCKSSRPTATSDPSPVPGRAGAEYFVAADLDIEQHFRPVGRQMPSIVEPPAGGVSTFIRE